ncbi:unnamed protein product [Camellia sinensis]
MLEETVQFLQNRNASVVIHNERDFNVLCVRGEVASLCSWIKGRKPLLCHHKPFAGGHTSRYRTDKNEKGN